MEQKKLLLLLSIVLVVVTIWSLINPKDYLVWLLEVFPAIIGVIILIATYKKFPFTNIVYVLIALHIIVLIVGGHYTYEENPLFNWLKDVFNLSRNHYDRLGHFFQGFVPIMIAREILLRTTKLERGKMFIFLLLCVVAFVTAVYELLEWGSTLVVAPEQGIAFLGIQGDIWDAQKDMLMAFLGGITSLVLFSRVHDRQLSNIKVIARAARAKRT